jgi:hypothetical protein
MNDDNKTLEIELSLKAEKFKEQLKEQTRDAKGMSSTIGRMEGKRSKQQEETLKLKEKISGPKANKAELTAAKMLYKFEKKKLDIIEDQIKAVKRLNAEIAKGGKGGKGGGNRFNRTLGGRPTAGGLGGAAKMVGGAGLGMALAAGGAYVGAVQSQIREGYGQWSQYRQAQGGLIGTGATMQGMAVARRRGVDRGYRPVESMMQARDVAQQTGNARAVTSAQDISRITGMDMGGASGFMGQVARAGGNFNLDRKTGGDKQLEKAIAAGFESGLERARMPEFIQGVGKLVEMQAGRQGGDVATGGFAQMLAAMGMTGDSGMQGARGANVLAQLNEAMVKPGGGDHGQALMLQAYGFGKPGGDTSYYEALKRQETGATSVENVKALFAETQSQYGGGQEQILALREMTGLSITQLESLREGVDNLDDGALKEAIEKSKPIDEQSLTQMKEMGGHLQRLAGLDDRLVNIGDQFAANIESLQDAVNTGIDKGLPFAEGTLNMVTSIKDALFTKWGLDKDADREWSHKAVGATESAYEKAASAYGKGEITREEYEKIADKQMSDMQSAGYSRETHMNTRTKARDLAKRILKEKMSGVGGSRGMAAQAAILSGDASQYFGEGEEGKKYQAMLDQYRMDAEYAASTDDGGKDDMELRNSLRTGGDFHSLLLYVMQTLEKTGQTLDKAAILAVDGKVKANFTPPAVATSGPNG